MDKPFLKLTNQELTLRQATIEDAKILCSWWNNGQIMAHAGFPKGLGTNHKKIILQIKTLHVYNQLLIIELNDRPNIFIKKLDLK